MMKSLLKLCRYAFLLIIQINVYSTAKYSVSYLGMEYGIDT